MTIRNLEGFLWERKREFLGKEVFLSSTLKERLRQARQELTPKRGGYVSQETLAAEVGVTGVTLGNYESGATEPSLQMVERLARVLGVTPGYLAFGEGAPRVALAEPDVLRERPVSSAKKPAHRKQA